MKGSTSVVIIILIEVRRLPPGVFRAKMARIVLLAVPLTGNGSLLEWLVTITAPSVGQGGLASLNNDFLDEKMF